MQKGAKGSRAMVDLPGSGRGPTGFRRRLLQVQGHLYRLPFVSGPCL